jgi:hypothetical protein
MHRGRMQLLVCTGLVLAGCGHPKPLPAWTEPLDPVDMATDPPPANGDPHPEQLDVITGTTSAYTWGHARGWIHAPVDQVWKAMQDVDVIVDRRKDSSWAVTKQDIDPTAAVSFSVKNLIMQVVTVEIDTDWREGPVEGTESDPDVVAIRNDLTNSSLFVTTLDDSVRLQRVDSNTTEIQIMRHIQTVSTSENDVKVQQNDLFNSIVASVHGQPLPKY